VVLPAVLFFLTTIGLGDVNRSAECGFCCAERTGPVTGMDQLHLKQNFYFKVNIPIAHHDYLKIKILLGT
jgi:hypothetical protein